MKRSLLLILLFVSYLMVSAQISTDIIYLKSGSVIKGTITEQIVGQSIVVQSQSGAIQTILISDIDHFEKAESSASSSPLISAPVERVKPFQVDLIAGPGISWLSNFNNNLGYDGVLKASYSLGIMTRYAFNDKLGFETGIGLLSNAGNAYSGNPTGWSYNNGQIDLMYLYVPLLLKYDFLQQLNIINGKSAGIMVGPQFGYCFLGTDSGTSSASSDDYFYTITDGINPNIDFVIGIFGYAGNSGFSCQLNWGLNKVFDNSNADIKNRSVSFLYTYRF